MSLNLRRNKGSLLLEALLATVILSVSIVFIIRSMATSAQATAYTVNYTRAVMLLDNKLFEVLRDAKQKSIVDSGSFDSPDANFAYRIDAELVKAEGTKNLEKIDATVSWKLGNKRQQLPLSTYRMLPAE